MKEKQEIKKEFQNELDINVFDNDFYKVILEHIIDLVNSSKKENN